MLADRNGADSITGQKGFWIKNYTGWEEGSAKGTSGTKKLGGREGIKTDRDSCYRGFIHLGSIKFAAGRTIIASRFVLSCPPTPPSFAIVPSLRSREFSVKTFVALLIRLIPLPVLEETKLSIDRRGWPC